MTDSIQHMVEKAKEKSKVFEEKKAEKETGGALHKVLDQDENNILAISLYKKFGFIFLKKINKEALLMKKVLF